MGFLKVLQRMANAITHRSISLPFLLERLLNTDTLQKAQKLIEHCPELLSEKADHWLEQLIEAQKSAKDREMLQEHRELLKHCRAVGVDAAFAEKLSNPIGTAPEFKISAEDEDRLQAQVALIEQLLGCPQGQKASLLQANAELVNADLLVVIKQYIAHLESQDNETTIRLRELAAQLAQTLGLVAAVPSEMEAAQFARETLRLVYESKGNPQQIYLVWAQQQAQFNETLLAVLPIIAEQFLVGDAERRTVVAGVLDMFGNLISRFPLGIRWLNLELGITAYQQALTVVTQEAMPFDWAQTMTNLAIAYRNRIRGDWADNLEQAINYYQQALTVVTQEAMPFNWARTMTNLAGAYSSRIRGDRADNLEQAVSCCQQALTVMTQEAMPFEWSSNMNNLALANFFRIYGDRADNLEKAISCCQQALTVVTQEAMPFDWAQTMMNLGSAYSFRIHGDRADNLEKAIDGYQQVLTVMTQEAMPVDWAQTMYNLANANFFRIRGDRADNFERAIAAYQQALTVMTQEAMPFEWAQIMMSLAGAYSSRIRGDRANNLEQAINYYQQALTVRTQQDMPFEWAQTMVNLAEAYRNRIFGDRAESLEQAIAASQKALTVMTQEAMPFEWATAMNNLGSAYANSIRGDRAENLEQAIAAYQKALTVTTQEAMPFEWARNMMNLGNAYRDRIRGDEAENLEQAIAAYQKALTVMTQETMPFEWAITMNNLANAYLFHSQGDQADNIEQAITACQQAITVATQEAMPFEWSTTINTLGIAYRNRIHGDRADNLERAINCCQQALTVRTQQEMPIEWAPIMMNLAITYRDRICGDRTENIEQAIEAYQASLSIFKPELLPVNCRRSAHSLGNLYSEQQRWQEAALTYQEALWASELLYQSANLLDSKAAELSETGDLPQRAAYALARSGNLQAAVLTLEQGRARGLSETLERDRFDLTRLQQMNQDLFNQYRDITTQLRNLETQQRSWITSDERYSLTPEAFRTEALRLRQALTETIEHIRQMEGYTDFLTQPGFNDIQQAVRPAVPLVYLVLTPLGSLALIATQTGIADLWLDELSSTNLVDLFNNIWLNSYRHLQTNHKGWFEAIDQVTHQLWQPLMAPLVAHLKQHSFQQATLIPTGYLSLMPLHAAWVDDLTQPTGKRYVLDEICFTYAPNARSINAATTIAQHTGAESILAINNPRKNLPNSSREVAAAIASFPQHQVLQHEAATISSVLDALPHCSILHLSCHGTANLNEPLTSGLLMSDGLLTLRDLLDLRVTEQEQGGIRLAVLSACETGLVGTELADEAIGLPTGLLQAGVAGVVASLWSVADISTMMLLTHFYDLWCKRGLEPAEALRQAQQWVRDTTSQQKATYFKGTNPDIFQFLILLDPDYFAHPFHWAAFTYMGV